jgi:flagellin-specific chaperone FliS
MIIDKLHAKLDTKKFTEIARAITSIYEPILLCNFGRTEP